MSDRPMDLEHCIVFRRHDTFILLYEVDDPGEISGPDRASASAYLREHEDSPIGEYARIGVAGTPVQPGRDYSYAQRFSCTAERDLRLSDIYNLTPATFEAGGIEWRRVGVMRGIQNEFSW